MGGLHAGATVLPPMPAFYHRPETINDLLAQTSGKILDQFGNSTRAPCLQRDGQCQEQE